MEQNPPWEANGSSASQEIPHIFMEPEGFYSFHKKPPLNMAILNVP